MATAFLTIILVLAIIGSIVFDRVYVKNIKSDAVFGNPERANGGYHWIIAGSCSILLLWLYFSWDIARSFYPQSANELCQIAKVRDSVLGINYIFPIEQRTLKSTAFIEREKKIIRNLKKDILVSSIEKSKKNKLIDFIEINQSLISILSNDVYLETSVQNKIDVIANEILSLTKRFEHPDYPLNSSLKNEFNFSSVKQASWGATGMEIPTNPETQLGLKFAAASIEMSSIVDNFFEIKNESPTFVNLRDSQNLELKTFKKNLKEEEALAQNYLRKISKSFGRISRSNIFPSTTLDNIQIAIENFDYVQKSKQGNLQFIDFFLFPTGTIVASGETCSEQGTGRWLPKPTDTLKIFIDILQPSVGYKNFPMIWYQWIGFNQVIDFFIPDFLADLIPGKYPVHSDKGEIETNFKKRILIIATGDFETFKIPVPTGHIWDSFLRVFLGLTLGVLAGVPLGLFMGLSRFAKGYFDPVIELYRPVPPLAWAPLIITVFGIDNSGKIFLLFMVSFAIMIVSARAGASGMQLSKIHAAHSLGASKWQILSKVIFPNSLPEILTGIRVSIGVCWGTLVAAEFLAGTTGIGFVENVARKYMQYEHIWITIFVMGMLGMLFDIAMRWIISKTIPWRGKG